MKQIAVACTHCEHAFQVSGDLAGLLAECPRCGHQVTVPLPPSQAREAPRLKVKHESTISGATRCPSCGAPMEEGAVLCLQCGFHLQRGERIGQASGWPRVIIWVWVGAGLIILAGAVRFLLRPGSLEQAIPTPARPMEAPVTSAVATVESSPAPTPEPAAPPPEVQPDLAAAAGPSNAVPSAEELVRLEAEVRAELTARLDKAQPMYQPGERVELRQQNGLIIRGYLKALTPDAVLVMREEGETAVPLVLLDHQSRVRCDRAFRDRLIEWQVKKRTQER